MNMQFYVFVVVDKQALVKMRKILGTHNKISKSFRFWRQPYVKIDILARFFFILNSFNAFQFTLEILFGIHKQRYTYKPTYNHIHTPNK